MRAVIDVSRMAGAGSTAAGLLALHAAAAADGLTPDSGVLGLACDGSGAAALRGPGIGDANGRAAFDRPCAYRSTDMPAAAAALRRRAGGSIVAIDAACAADGAERVRRQLDGEGERRLDSGGGLTLYTYGLTRLGAVVSGRGTPPPVVHTCSVRPASPCLAVQAGP